MVQHKGTARSFGTGRKVTTAWSKSSLACAGDGATVTAMADPFLARDFLVYERHRQDDPEYNALRLSVRRKLKAMVDVVQKDSKPLGVELSAQAGLHHPYTFNSYRVREQRAYLCRGPKERKKLASFFGEDRKS